MKGWNGDVMKRLGWILFGAGLALLCTSAAQADAIYNIAGTLNIPANSAHPGVSETINYNFDLLYADHPGEANSVTVRVVGTPKIESFGPVNMESSGTSVWT